jgi:putative flippase GtrA
MKNYTSDFILQFFKYFAVALIGFAVDFGSLIFLHELLGLYYLIAASIGFVLGLMVTYTLSNRYVFSNPKSSSRLIQFTLFAVIGMVGLVILNIMMWVFTSRMHINYAASKLIATVFVYTWNFLARRSLYSNTA